MKFDEYRQYILNKYHKKMLVSNNIYHN